MALTLTTDERTELERRTRSRKIRAEDALDEAIMDSAPHVKSDQESSEMSEVERFHAAPDQVHV
jgi:hypothetical protein